MPPVREPERHDSADEDALDRICAQWAGEMPELDTRPIAIVGRLLRVTRYLEREIEMELARFGLNISEFNILAALCRSGPPHQLPPVELSRSLLLSSGGLTKRIAHLEAVGLVTRHQDPDDGRGLLVTLTAIGHDLLKVALPAHVQNEERLIAALDPDERGALADLLRAMLIAFGDGAPAHDARAYRLGRRRRDANP